MTPLHLPGNFAEQSSLPSLLRISQLHRHAGSVATLVEADRYPRAGIVRIPELLPGRHYLVRGAADRFCRTDEHGTARLELTLAGPALLLLSAVV